MEAATVRQTQVSLAELVKNLPLLATSAWGGNSDRRAAHRRDGTGEGPRGDAVGDHGGDPVPQR